MKALKLSLIFFSIAASLSAHAATVPYNSKINTTIKNIENYGTFIVVNLSKDVENVAGCVGPVIDGQDTSDITGLIRSFYLDITTADGKAKFVQIIAASSAKKKTEFTVSSCDITTDLPIIDSLSVLY